MSHVLHFFIHIGNLHMCILPHFLHGGMSIMCDLHCSCDANLCFFCVGTFSDSYPRCFAALLANASARFILWFQRNWKDRTYCSSRAASLVPNPSRVLNSLGTYFFRWRHTWSSNCVPVSFRLPFTLTILLNCIFTWTTLRNGRRNFLHSDRQDLAPSAWTQHGRTIFSRNRVDLTSCKLSTAGRAPGVSREKGNLWSKSLPFVPLFTAPAHRTWVTK